ncbi:MAG: HAD-IA family hydrolase [Gammaproteobacteria bacterium]
MAGAKTLGGEVPEAMLDWASVETVLLDLDGTLLDLHFDTHFWTEHLPLRYAERSGIGLLAAKAELAPRLKAREGSLAWYCVDHWTRELGIEIAEIKREVAHLIAPHPRVPEFLAALSALGKRVMLATNAHPKSLAIKLPRVGLTGHFDAILCAHDFGAPKEHPRFWELARTHEPFDGRRTLLIDDNLACLRAAKAAGVRFLYGVLRPDSRAPPNPPSEFPAITGFGDIMPPCR